MKLIMMVAVVAGTLGIASGARADEVWTPNPLTPVYEGPDYARELHSGTNADAAVPHGLTFFGAKNGAFSAQAVVYMAASGRGPEVKLSDLLEKNGKNVIPASMIEVRYAWPTGINGNRGKQPPGSVGNNIGIFDALDTKPRESGTTHPVWLTVNVPADAVAGEYEGKLAVGGQAVPVKLVVADWTLPKPIDYQTWADFIQSPESVALRYGVELWSDKHWQLIGKTFEQLAKVGNKTLYIELIAKTNLGNEQSMVRWIKTGEKQKEKAPPQPGGMYKEYMDKEGKTYATTEPVFTHDFSIVEKYLDLYIKKAGLPKAVILYFYEPTLCGGYGKKAEDIMRGAPVTVCDPATKQVSTFEGPSHNVPNIPYPNYPDETIAFWKPVIDGLRDRLHQRGLNDNALLLGLSGDYMPGKGDVTWWKQTFPFARFAKQGHGLANNVGVMEVGYCTTVWNAAIPSLQSLNKQGGGDMAKVRMHGWQNPRQVCQFARDIGCFSYRTQLLNSRLIGEMNIAGNQRGFGRMSADFWACLKDAKGQFTKGISARYPESNWHQLNLLMLPYLHCGLDGAETTIRFEMLREGVEECEAVILIDKALVDKTRRAKLGDELAKRCQDLLDERTHALMKFNDEYGKGAESFPDSGWQERSARLYALAGEVEKTLSGK